MTPDSINEFEDLPTFETDELLGVQINFDDARGRVWFPLNDGLTLVYGKNGSGKTQILNCIKLVLQGIKSASGMQLDAHKGVLPSKGKEIELVVRAKPKSKYGGGLFEALKRNTCKHLATEFYSLYEPESTVPLNEITNFNNLWISFCNVFSFEPSFLKSEWFRSEEGSEEFSNWVKDDWHLLTKLWVFAHWISHPSQGQLNPSENKLSNEDISLIKSFIREIATDQIVIIKPVGALDSPKWLVQLGADTFDGASARGRIASETARAWTEFLFDNMDSNGAIRGVLDHANFIENTEITKSFFAHGMGYGEAIHSRFLNVQFYVFEDDDHEISSIPFSLLDLSNLEPVLEQLSSKALQSNGEFDFLAKTGDTYLELINSDSDHFGISEIRGAIQKSIKAIVGVGININDISILMNSSLSEIANRKLFDLQISDNRTPNELINYSALSDAQQRVIEILIAIALAENQNEKLVVVLGDEIDRSLHEVAISSFYKQLQVRKLPIIAATHSFQALANTQCRKRHVISTVNGISNVRLTASDIDKASEDLGVTKSSLLGLTQLFVVVEGEHDQIILNEIFDSNDLLSDLRVQVLPMRGTVNVLRVLDSRLLKYSDALVLVVADNGLNDVIGSRLLLAKDLYNTNLGIQEIKVQILKTQTSDESQEEKQLTHLIIDALENRMLDRLSIFAMSKGDIIEYLEASQFGLTKTWTSLRSEHAQWSSQSTKGSKRDFKSFLRTQYGAIIEPTNIHGAAKTIDMLHSELIALVDQVRLHLNANI